MTNEQFADVVALVYLSQVGTRTQNAVFGGIWFVLALYYHYWGA